ncbi:hypothetical protein FFLO_00249 [Filobasidium floriforme]|uniref:Uncharacterized protein n=1 Tax=Filobasidium floriforme TaxID=5210 RepID=A0A8K0JRQ7_9TREE|nr:uncharacterized protein HD553DRAFT_59824 [Filobasidium floriforme]KAG7575430.1 hypothetical protein FFLO_00249 [Filobasidium floriforme]KAH8082565.1 hypothetical protein HD553DRAFT_59824 [Filobasidium floriforme]
MTPLLDSQGFWEINKKTVVDCLVAADRRFNRGAVSKGEVTGGLGNVNGGGSGKSAKDGGNAAANVGSGRKRFRSNSGSDLRTREAQLTSDFHNRDERQDSGRVTPATSIINGGSSSGLSRFLSRSNRDRDQSQMGTRSKVSIDSSRPLSIIQNPPVPASPRLNLNVVGAEEQKPKKLGFLRRMTRSGRQESNSANNALNSAPMGEAQDEVLTTKTLTSIFGTSSSKIRSKEKSQRRSGKSRDEELQVRSVDRTIRPKDALASADDDVNVSTDVTRSNTTATAVHPRALHGLKTDLPTASMASGPSSSSKLREQQVQEVLLAYISKRMTSWDLKKELVADPADDGEGLTASGSERGSTILRSGSRLGTSRRPSRGSENERSDGKNSKKGMMELEALNAKLAQIEFEVRNPSRPPTKRHGDADRCACLANPVDDPELRSTFSSSHPVGAAQGPLPHGLLLLSSARQATQRARSRVSS